MKEGHYESYRDRDLPEGYTPNTNKFGRTNSNANEYDQYEYNHGESPVKDTPKGEPCERLKSCCNDLGRLFGVILYSS